MNILCAWVPNYRYGSCYEETHYFNALKEKDDVKIFPLIMPDDQSVQSVDGKLMEAIDLIKPDIFISWIYKHTIRKETFDYISKSNVVTVGMFGDDEKFFYDHSTTPSKDYTKLFNHSITTYKPAIEWHNQNGANNVFYMPYSANHKIFKKIKVEQDIPVSFCGAKKNNRIETLNTLMLAGIKLKVYGIGWGTRELLPVQYVNLINRTKVNINLSTDMVGGKEIIQVKGRDFEVPMAGGFLLTHDGEIREFYKPGKEIEVYNTEEEMVDKIKFYLMKEDRREKIANAGHERAIENHRSIDRVRGLLKQIKRGM